MELMKKLLLLMSICCLLILSSCTSVTTEGRTQNGRLKITATIFPYYDLVKTVVRDRADLNLVVPLGIEPHEYEPSAREIADIYNSDLFIYNGFGMEPWADKIKSDLEKKGVKVLRISDYLSLIRDRSRTSFNLATFNTSDSQGNNNTDPHLWLDLGYMRNIASISGEVIQNLDSSAEDKKFFADNTQTLVNNLSTIESSFKSLSSCRGKEFITGHAAFGYLSSEFGLTNYSVNGPTTEGEPGSGRIAEIINLMKQHNLSVIYMDNLSTPKYAQVIADQVGAKIGILYTLENLTKEEWDRGETYLSLMGKNLNSLKAGLDCGA